MKKFLLFILLSVSLYAGNNEDGLSALKQGDYESAMANFIFAANGGDTIAMQNLGVMYHEGIGVPQDREKAAYWFNKAGDMNDAHGGLPHVTNCGCSG